MVAKNLLKFWAPNSFGHSQFLKRAAVNRFCRRLKPGSLALVQQLPVPSLQDAARSVELEDQTCFGLWFNARPVRGVQTSLFWWAGGENHKVKTAPEAKAQWPELRLIWTASRPSPGAVFSDERLLGGSEGAVFHGLLRGRKSAVSSDSRWSANELKNKLCSSAAVWLRTSSTKSWTIKHIWFVPPFIVQYLTALLVGSVLECQALGTDSSQGSKNHQPHEKRNMTMHRWPEASSHLLNNATGAKLGIRIIRPWGGASVAEWRKRKRRRKNSRAWRLWTQVQRQCLVERLCTPWPDQRSAAMRVWCPWPAGHIVAAFGLNSGVGWPEMKLWGRFCNPLTNYHRLNYVYIPENWTAFHVSSPEAPGSRKHRPFGSHVGRVVPTKEATTVPTSRAWALHAANPAPQLMRAGRKGRPVWVTRGLFSNLVMAGVVLFHQKDKGAIVSTNLSVLRDPSIVCHHLRVQSYLRAKTSSAKHSLLLQFMFMLEAGQMALSCGPALRASTQEKRLAADLGAFGRQKSCVQQSYVCKWFVSASCRSGMGSEWALARTRWGTHVLWMIWPSLVDLVQWHVLGQIERHDNFMPFYWLMSGSCAGRNLGLCRATGQWMLPQHYAVHFE